jgi:hypothetical protein
VHQHITYADFALLPESREGLFTGAFVRNPYDRVYSGFLQLQRDVREQPSAPFPRPWIKAMVMRQLADNYAQLAAGNFDFDNWFSLVEEYQIYEAGHNSSFPLYPSHYWTGVDRRRNVDFVGKTENFEPDFDAFCQEIGLRPPRERANANVSGLVSDSQMMGRPRYAHLMKAASISKINTLFDADFELFGYEKQHVPD